MNLPSPALLQKTYPIPNDLVPFFRKQACEILQGKDQRLALILGPCSIHDPHSAIEYAHKVKELSKEVQDSFFLIMRCFLEKPRTKLGWKGFLYDPFLDESYDLEEGLHRSRKLLTEIASLGVPCAMEFLDPNLATYFADLITWGLIGARTCSSQPHRQMASAFSFPIGFKNGIDGSVDQAIHGRLDCAIAGILNAHMAQSHFGLNLEGRISAIYTDGNPFAHLVLRGSEREPNYHSQSIQLAQDLLKQYQLPPSILIDCSHGNSQKCHVTQKQVFTTICHQAKENLSIRGLMLESHLHSGKQSLQMTPLQYGVSITDACLGWEETETLIRSTSMMRVQK